MLRILPPCIASAPWAELLEAKITRTSGKGLRNHSPQSRNHGDKPILDGLSVTASYCLDDSPPKRVTDWSVLLDVSQLALQF